MNIGKYCKDKGFTKEEYNNFKNNIILTANAIRNELHYKGGMYFETSSILRNNIDEDIRYFIIQELKNMGVEFIKDNIYYRITD